jgi:hypothetical protein
MLVQLLLTALSEQLLSLLMGILMSGCLCGDYKEEAA